MFKYVIENDLMPPWSVDPNTGPWEKDLSLTVREKAVLLKWLKEGTPKKGEKTRKLWDETGETFTRRRLELDNSFARACDNSRRGNESV